MDRSVVVTRLQPLTRVACGSSASQPDVLATEPSAATTGVFQLSHALSVTDSGQDGTAQWVRLLPGLNAAGSYTLRVYGYHKVAGQTIWVPTLLWEGTVNCNVAVPGTDSSAAFNTAETAAGTFTPVATVNTTTFRTVTGAGIGSLTLESMGSPYLLFQASDTNAFVLVSGLT